MFAPGTTLKFGFGLGKVGLQAGIAAVTGIWKLVPAALGALGLLGQTVGSAGKGAGVKGALGKAGGALLTLGRFGSMFAMGPAGAIVLAAGAGFAFTVWFKSTELGKDLMRMGEEASAELNKDVLGQEGRELAETTVSDADLGIVQRDVGKDEANNALRQSYINMMKISEPGSDTYELNKKALERLDRQMVDPGLAKGAGLSAPPPSTAQQLKTDAMNNGSSNRPMIVDGSNNTTNNIGQSNTTLSAPPPSSAQNDDYSGALNSRMNLSTGGYLN